MTKWKQVFRNYSKLKKKKEILHSHSYSYSYFTQYFVEASLAVIIASSLLGYDATSLARLYLGNFCHSILQILSSSIWLDGERWCTAIFKSLQRCSIGFKSRLWLGHSRTFTYLPHSMMLPPPCFTVGMVVAR